MTAPTIHQRPTPTRPDGRRSRPGWRVLVGVMGVLIVILLALAAVVFLREAGRTGEETGEGPEGPGAGLEEPGEGAEEPGADTQEPAAPEVRYGEEEPANWDVTGVAPGEGLSVYAEPGRDNPVRGEVAADAEGLESTGRIAWLDGQQWREIKGTVVGWVDARYLTETRPTIVYGEEPRANWDVTGVAADDVLNVRSGPGVDTPGTDTLAPTTVELESTGRIAHVDGALWREIVVPGATTGWVNARFLTETRPPG